MVTTYFKVYPKTHAESDHLFILQSVATLIQVLTLLQNIFTNLFLNTMTSQVLRLFYSFMNFSQVQSNVAQHSCGRVGGGKDPGVPERGGLGRNGEGEEAGAEEEEEGDEQEEEIQNAERPHRRHAAGLL